jgi:hypothetical protein
MDVAEVNSAAPTPEAQPAAPTPEAQPAAPTPEAQPAAPAAAGGGGMGTGMSGVAVATPSTDAGPSPASASSSASSGGGGGGARARSCCQLRVGCLLRRNHLGDCQRRWVQLVGADEADVAKAHAAADQLGAELLEDGATTGGGGGGSSLDPRCTHVVAYQLKRNERMLSALAAGRWVMEPSWVEQSVLADHWLPEDDFEVTPPTGSDGDGSPAAAEAAFGKGGKLWLGAPRDHRRRREAAAADQKPPGAFASWTFVLAHGTRPIKREQLGRIVRAGGGRVWREEALPHQEQHNLIVVLPEDAELEHPLWREARARDVPCVPPDFVVEQLTLKHPRGVEAHRMR